MQWRRESTIGGPSQPPAKMCEKTQWLFDAAAHEAIVRLGAFNSQGIAITPCAFAKKSPKLFDAVANEALVRWGDFILPFAIFWSE